MRFEAPHAGSRRGGPDPLWTVTHARIRAQQGDLAGARRILEARLAADPSDREARELLSRLGGSPARPERVQVRIVRLQAYLDRLRRNAGGDV